ncbi:hypothetical protein NX783_05150 [Massilia kyonggiensis]|nr:hypothetical protein [Massilia kyonggiensis]
MRILFGSACFLTLLAGCASMPAPRPLDTAGLAAVRNQAVAVTVRPKPGFSVLTPGKAGLAGVGIFVGDDGNRIIAEHHVADPADAIAQALARALHDAQGSQSVAAPIAVDTRDVTQIAAQAKGKARYVIDVETRAWRMSYFPTDWTHYQVPYIAVARLIDADTAGVLAESTCNLAPETNAGAPTYDDLVTNGAAGLKASLAASAATCAARFRRDMFALRDTRPADAAAVPSTSAAEAVVWNGIMACSARNDSGPNAGAYEAKFTVDVRGQAVHAHRRTADVEETLVGEVRGDRLELRGTGNRIADPARSWGLGVIGAFAPDAASYVGKGSMVVGGRPIRACELRMTRA